MRDEDLLLLILVVAVVVGGLKLAGVRLPLLDDPIARFSEIRWINPLAHR